MSMGQGLKCQLARCTPLERFSVFPMALHQTCPLTLGGRPNSQVFFTSLLLCLHRWEGGEEKALTEH